MGCSPRPEPLASVGVEGERVGHLRLPPGLVADVDLVVALVRPHAPEAHEPGLEAEGALADERLAEDQGALADLVVLARGLPDAVPVDLERRSDTGREQRAAGF